MLVTLKYESSISCEFAAANVEELLTYLKHQAEIKFIDRVINEIGLVVNVLDLHIKETLPIQSSNDGRPWFRQEADLIVFNPSVNSILTVIIDSCDRTGINLRIANFKNIKVPIEFLPANTQYNDEYENFIWNYDSKTHLIYEKNLICRVKVIDVIFNNDNTETKTNFAPMSILVSFSILNILRVHSTIRD